MDVHEITFGCKQVGTAKITRSGLYYQVDCECHLPQGLYRLYILAEHQQILVGVLQKKGTAYAITRKMSVHSVGNSVRGLVVLEKDENKDFFEVHEAKPIPQVCLLDRAFFKVEEGRKGIYFSGTYTSSST